jgi:hypothetical protein
VFGSKFTVTARVQESPESLKPLALPRIQIPASQTFLTLAYYRRQYFDQFEAKSNKLDIYYDLE